MRARAKDPGRAGNQGRKKKTKKTKVSCPSEAIGGPCLAPRRVFFRFFLHGPLFWARRCFSVLCCVDRGKRRQKTRSPLFWQAPQPMGQKKRKNGTRRLSFGARPARNKQGRSDCAAPKKDRVALCARRLHSPRPPRLPKKGDPYKPMARQQRLSSRQEMWDFQCPKRRRLLAAPLPLLPPPQEEKKRHTWPDFFGRDICHTRPPGTKKERHQRREKHDILQGDHHR